MKLLLNEMFRAEVAAALRSHGHDVGAVAERTDLSASSDANVIAFAVSDGRAVVTNNHKHYVTLHRRMLLTGPDHYGIVLTSDRSLPRTRRGTGAIVRALERMLREHRSLDALLNQLRWLS